MILLKSKKGILNDVAAGIVMLFTFGFIIIMCYLVLDKYITQLATTSVWNAQMADVSARFLFAMKVFDFVMVMLMVSVITGIGVTSYRVSSAPLFFIIIIIGSAFMGLIGYYFSYMFQEMVSEAVFIGVTRYFTRTILICTNLHWIGLATLVVGSIALYGKREKGQFIQ